MAGILQELSSESNNPHEGLEFPANYYHYRSAPRVWLNNEYGVFLADGETSGTFVLKLYGVSGSIGLYAVSDGNLLLIRPSIIQASKYCESYSIGLRGAVNGAVARRLGIIRDDRGQLVVDSDAYLSEPVSTGVDSIPLLLPKLVNLNGTILVLFGSSLVLCLKNKLILNDAITEIYPNL